MKGAFDVFAEVQVVILKGLWKCYIWLDGEL